MAAKAALEVVVLAAGQGKRMRSDLPKVLHPLAGRPLLTHVIEAAQALAPSTLCIVIGHGGDHVRSRLAQPGLTWALQESQQGTGHAVMQALPHLDAGGTVLVLYGDVPLIAPATLRGLVEAAGGSRVALLTQELDDPRGYGRIVRDGQGRVARIVEEKDASAAERAIREINTGIMALPGARLRGWLDGLRNENAQGEYYLTDVIAAAVADGVAVEVRQPAAVHECLGVNSKAELAAHERRYQAGEAARLLPAASTRARRVSGAIRGTSP